MIWRTLFLLISFASTWRVWIEAKTLYDILGVKPKASLDEIKQSYRKLAKKLHPDKNQDDPKAQEKFIELSKAYEILGNADNRRSYDMNLHQGFTNVDDMDLTNQGQGHRHRRDSRGFDEEFIVFQTPRGPVYVKFRGGDPFAAGPGQYRPQFNPFGDPVIARFFGGGQHFFDGSDNFQRSFWGAPPPMPLWYTILQIIWANWSTIFLFSLCTLFFYKNEIMDALFTTPPISQGAVPAKATTSRDSRSSEKDQKTDAGLTLFAGDLSEACVLYVIALSAQAEAKLLAVRAKYKKDPIRFLKHFGPSEAQGEHTSNLQDRLHFIALKKSGERWTALESRNRNVSAGLEADSLTIEFVDGWLLKMLLGEVKWMDISEEPLPVSLPIIRNTS